MNKGLLLAGLLILPGSAALADEISYTYVEGAYVHLDPDGLDSEDGIALKGSLSLGDHLYAFGEYAGADLDNFDLDVETLDLGIGLRFGIGDRLHALAEAAYVDAEAGFLDTDGYELSVGLRFAPNDLWEVGAKVGYSDLDDNLDGGFGEVNLLYKLSPLFGINATADLGDGLNTYSVGLRVSL